MTCGRRNVEARHIIIAFQEVCIRGGCQSPLSRRRCISSFVPRGTGGRAQWMSATINLIGESLYLYSSILPPLSSIECARVVCGMRSELAHTRIISIECRSDHPATSDASVVRRPFEVWFMLRRRIEKLGCRYGSRVKGCRRTALGYRSLLHFESSG